MTPTRDDDSRSPGLLRFRTIRSGSYVVELCTAYIVGGRIA